MISVICGDLREPAAIPGNSGPRPLIDPAEPTGPLMTGVMMFVSDSSDPPAAVEEFRAAFDTATEHMHFRSKTDIARFFEGLGLVPP